MPAVKEDYEVLEVIGQGSFGKVCRVRRVEDGKVLVWKEINYAHMRPIEKQRIADEVNILKDLRNPFIVRFYDHVIERASKKCYIIMEHCPGGDLRRLIKTCRREGRWIDEGFIWRVLAQLIVALKDCHRRARPILHRDIKPANVLLDQDRNIKLADFGLAKELDNERAFAATNVGTPYYMSPELVNHQSYDDGADLWSVGCLLYEAAALRPPFDASSHASLAHKINAGKISRIPDRYSDELQQVIRAMLHKNPAKRPQLETLEKAVPSLAPHLRESRALLLEYELQARYHARMKQVRAREEEVKQRETSLRCREDALERRQCRLIERERQLQRSLQTHASPLPSIPTSRPPSDSTLLLASVSASVQARETMRRPGLLTEEEEEEKEEDEENLSLGSQASALCDAATAAHRHDDPHTTLEEEGSEDGSEDEDEEGLVYRHQTAPLSSRRQDPPLGPPLPPPPRPRPSPRRHEAETGQPDLSSPTPPTPPHHAIPASPAASGSNSGAERGGGRGGRRSCPLSTPPPTTPKAQALFPSLVAPLSANRENTPTSLKRSTPPPPLAAPSPISALPSSRGALRPRNPNVALPSHAGQAALQFDSPLLDAYKAQQRQKQHPLPAFQPPYHRPCRASHENSSSGIVGITSGTGYFCPSNDRNILLSPPSSYRPVVKGGKDGGRQGGRGGMLKSPNTSLMSIATTVSAASTSHHSISRFNRLI
ncbi:hypothetical protein NSK_006314 [Nannochloropsis salina CCMP1776]|uniref:non-specific serine/threonine protein kinase n=1 Tax=Nannochloropsis salina CCMP1776 TaxID=1027361 RepID=A0A4D9CYD3_9STRA|nr:hypothetical protein NSK_006314 [Nannochloropsis salina CCMP1776]|eukprot:TFJ82405.1 hypothetical protein NSK_006314 [Nannochloropsis salina CCMP1776]